MGNVLVIDDDPTYCKLVSLHLSRAGHEVTSTDDGATATGLIARGAVDLVLLDLNMPKMNGEVFLEVLRTDARRRSTPVIVVTAAIGSDRFKHAQALGIQGAVDKTTLKYPELIALVNSFLAGK
jgi:two-component system, chemotaxis family, chemotaxis protein CheY